MKSENRTCDVKHETTSEQLTMILPQAFEKKKIK